MEGWKQRERGVAEKEMGRRTVRGRVVADGAGSDAVVLGTWVSC